MIEQTQAKANQRLAGYLRLNHAGERAPAYSLMKDIIQTGCKTAIKIAEKIWLSVSAFMLFSA